MLAKYRGLTLIGGFAMAVAIAIGATAFETLNEMLTPALPFEDGDRVVSLQYATANPGNGERGLLDDFAAWREALTSIEDLGAFRTVQHNLVSPYATPEPIKLAEMTASGFAIARTRPLLGRYLLPADEHAAAAPVVVIGYRRLAVALRRRSADRRPHHQPRRRHPHASSGSCRAALGSRSIISSGCRSAPTHWTTSGSGADHLRLRPAGARRHQSSRHRRS